MNEVLRHDTRMFSFVLRTNTQLAQNVKMKMLNEIQERKSRKVVQQTNINELEIIHQQNNRKKQ